MCELKPWDWNCPETLELTLRYLKHQCEDLRSKIDFPSRVKVLDNGGGNFLAVKHSSGTLYYALSDCSEMEDLVMYDAKYDDEEYACTKEVARENAYKLDLEHFLILKELNEALDDANNDHIEGWHYAK